MKTDFPKILAYYRAMTSNNSIFRYKDDKCTLETILTRPDRTLAQARQQNIVGSKYLYSWVPAIATKSGLMRTMFLSNGMKVTVHTNEIGDGLFKFEQTTKEEKEAVQKLLDNPKLNVVNISQESNLG